MATFRYFGPNGVRLDRITSIDRARFASQFPGVKPHKSVSAFNDSFTKRVGTAPDGSMQPVLRVIEFKTNPSLHKCDARCLHAKGNKCECSCGGKNHGAGG